MTVPVKQPTAVPGDIMEQVLLKGDIGKLTPAERVSYYDAVCRSMGLNPYTKPFEFIVLNGRMQLYALRNCTDQLRKINAVSLEIISKEITDDIMTVHVRAKLPDGRVDEDLGAVAYPATLKGEARANAELKCITKAKRRATLSICGLSFLDETEVEDIPANGKRANPHVTTAADLQASETPVQYGVDGEPIDNIPQGDPDIQPRPKKDMRKAYENLQKEMYAVTNPTSLLKWGGEIRNEVAMFPQDWQAMFRDLFKAHLESLRRKTRPTSEHDPETGEVKDMVPDPIDPPYYKADERT